MMLSSPGAMMAGGARCRGRDRPRLSTPLVAVIKPASLVTTILTRGLSVVLALLLAFLIATIA